MVGGAPAFCWSALSDLITSASAYSSLALLPAGLTNEPWPLPTHPMLLPLAPLLPCRTPRLQAACTMLMLQNSMVAASATAALALLWGGAREGPLFYSLLAVAMAAGAVSSLGSMGSTVSVEREWTKALCGERSEELAKLNAGGCGWSGCGRAGLGQDVFLVG